MRHKVGLYLRVSTEEQAQIIEGSLDSQKHRLMSFVDLKNLQENHWGKVVETYTDEGLSAKDTKRPAFQKMMRDIRNGKINLILVTDLSRLSRNILDFCILLEDLKKANAKFLSLKEQFDTSTPAGEMMVFNMINLAQFERKQTSERVSMNFHARAMRGLRNGGMSILGYDTEKNDPSKLIVNDVEAGYVRKIFQIYLEEYSISQTIKRIEALNIKPKDRQNRVQKHASRGIWSTQSMQALLRNHAYIGLREVNAKNKNKDQDHLKPYEQYQIVKASWEAIIDKKVFNSVQKSLDENLARERKRLSSAQSRTFYLTGILYCEDCGRPLVGSSGHGEGGVSRYYVHRPIRGEVVNCSVKTIRADDLEDAILNHMEEVIFRNGYFNGLEKRLSKSYNQSQDDKKVILSKGQGELLKIDREIQKTIEIMSELSAKGMDIALKDTLIKFTDKRKEIENQIAAISDNDDQSYSSKDDREFIELNATTFLKAKKKATPAMLKRLLHNLISAIVLSKGKASISYWTRTSFDSLSTNTNDKMASDIKSGATSLLLHKHRKFILSQKNDNTLPSNPKGSNGMVESGYIVKNGAP